MKRITAILLLIAMALTLCACSGGGNASDHYTRCDENGNPKADGGYLLFGEYPQSMKAEGVRITDKTDARGYCLGDDGCYYAKVTAAPCAEDYTFSNGDAVTAGEVYYFKVEPILWQIISEKDGKATLLAVSVLDHSAVQSATEKSGKNYYTTANGAPASTPANSYYYSEVRAWLNTSFAATAFTDAEDGIILTTTVDNSGGIYASANSEDKLFLLSRAEVESAEYGFGMSADEKTPARTKLTTDYARANGTWMKTTEEYYGNGTWWLRTPWDSSSGKASRVDSMGKVDEGSVTSGQYGVAPSLVISLR